MASAVLLRACFAITFLALTTIILGCESEGGPRREGGPADVGHHFDVDAERTKQAIRIADNSQNNKPLVLILFVAGNWELDHIRNPDALPQIRALCNVRIFRIENAYDYDEGEFRNIWSQHVASGQWDVSFDQYLQMKDYPYMYDDIKLLRRFGVFRTPCAMVFDRKGRLLDLKDGDIDDLGTMILRRAVSD